MLVDVFLEIHLVQKKNDYAHVRMAPYNEWSIFLVFEKRAMHFLQNDIYIYTYISILRRVLFLDTNL